LLVELAERKRSEEALRESEMRFRLVTQAANEAIWDYNFASGQVWWNEGIKSLFGYPDDEKSSDYGWWEERLHPDDKDEVLSNFNDVIVAGGQYWTGQYRFRRAGGRYAGGIVRGVIVRDEGGAAIRVMGSLVDITERKR